ncbi:MAG TPA: lipopolysaccharide biosynthesis protein, partial [Vibrio sp.]|nr:lipopolysaccharide biosynthesis protein [Vibrio sp.]
FATLWQGKLWIISLTIVSTLCAGVFAYIQPNIYQSSATVRVELNPFFESLSSNVQGQIVETTNDALPYLASIDAKKAIVLNTGQSLDILNGLSISKDREGNINVSQQSTSPESAYQSVMLYSKKVDSVFKTNELYKVNTALKATERLVNSQQGKVQEVLAEKYAQLLFKQAILQSPDSELIKVISEPVLPKNHIKPKRALIVALGTLLGGMLGVAVVLIRFAFRKENSIAE